MIQRKQTIFLLLAAIFAFLTLQVSFFTGSLLGLGGAKSFVIVNAKYNTINTIVTVAVAVIALVCVFLYSDRKKQILFSSIATLLSIVTIFLYYIDTKKFVDITYSITCSFSFFIIIFLLLAIKGIISDQQLIKNADRLR
jgi:Domain of unknown function (DUF4293)